MSVVIKNQDLTNTKWNLDITHSEVGFSVRHAGISKVKGIFKDFASHIHFGESLEDSQVIATISTNSVSTNNLDRDNHLKSPDFFNSEEFPTMEFTSVKIKEKKGDYKVIGNLTLAGVTKEVELDVDFNGFAVDPYGQERAGLEATTKISRKEFGLTWNTLLEAGGVLVRDEVKIILELSFIKENNAE